MKIHTATKRTSIRRTLFGAVAGALGVTLAAWNAGAADFYRGKTMTLVVSAGAGGGYGLFSQLLAKHLPKYIPGEPKIVLQYNGASGGLVAANHLYNVAPKDGTAIGMLRSTLPISQVLRPSGIKYDAAKLTWIGRMTAENSALGVWHKAPATTLAAAMDKEIVIGAGGKSGALYIFPMIVKKITGARFKIVSGYRGTNDVVIAMERGEAHAVVADYQAWKAKWGHFIKDRRIVPIFQTGMKRLGELPDVPTLMDLAKTDDERTIMRLLSAPAEIGKAISGPPGIPADRVEVLRRAFEAAIRDPELIAAAKARNVAVNPRSGAELASLVAKALATRKPLIERTKALLEY
jgi:tripartite-type tricarboxylate transporter receptor subunit TctC